MKLDKNYKVRVTPEQSRKIHSLILLDGGEVSYGLKPQLQDEFLVIENEHGSVVIYYTDQDIFLSAEQQEIQADDLITLLTDLPKSAENPLQGVELTPELEAVEPVLSDNCVNIQDIDTDILDTNTDIKDTPKFKVGDKVYVGLTGKIARVTKIIDDDVVNVANKNNEVRAWVSNICHATQENYERLQATFTDIKFEQPPKPLTGSDLCRAMLEKGWKYVPCYVHDGSDDEAINRKHYVLVKNETPRSGYNFSGTGANDWKYAVPIDPRTGEPLTESILND